MEHELRDLLYAETGGESIEALLHCDASPADAGATSWAQSESLPAHAYPASIRRHGADAPAMRNRRMLDEAGPGAVVLVFPGGSNAANLVEQALARGVPVIRATWRAKPKPRRW